MTGCANFLQRGPLELISSIFQHCQSGQDMLALAATCRHVRSAWLCLPGRYRLALGRDIACFEEALIVSRMAEAVVRTEIQDAVSPRALSPDDYSSLATEPSLREIKAVFAIDRLVECLERAFRTHDVTLPPDRVMNSESLPEAPDRMPEWSKRVRKAIYRTFIVGAALADAYYEPIRQAHANSDEEIQQIGPHDLELSAKQIIFLKNFAVYNLNATDEAEEAVFGPTANWLIQSILEDTDARTAMAKRFERGEGRAKHCQLFGDCPVQLHGVDGHHPDAHLIVWEIAQMLWAHFHIESSVHHQYDLSTALGTDSNPEDKMARVVLFGMFSAEDLMVPDHNSASRILIKSYHALEPNSEIMGSSQSISSSKPPCPFLSYSTQVFYRSGTPNTFEPFGEAPPLILKWFSYILRQYMGLRFADGIFDHEQRNLIQDFYEGITIFSHDDVKGRSLCDSTFSLAGGDLLNGTEIFEPALPPPDLVFRELEDNGVYPFW